MTTPLERLRSLEFIASLCTDHGGNQAPVMLDLPVYSALIDIAEAAQEWDRVWKPPVAHEGQALADWKLHEALAALTYLLPQHLPEDEREIVGYCDTSDGCDVPHPIRRKQSGS